MALWRELWREMSISFIVVSSTGWLEVGKDAIADGCVAFVYVKSNAGLTSFPWGLESRHICDLTGLLLAEEVRDEGEVLDAPFRVDISKVSASGRSVYESSVWCAGPRRHLGLVPLVAARRMLAASLTGYIIFICRIFWNNCPGYWCPRVVKEPFGYVAFLLRVPVGTGAENSDIRVAQRLVTPPRYRGSLTQSVSLGKTPLCVFFFFCFLCPHWRDSLLYLYWRPFLLR